MFTESLMPRLRWVLESSFWKILRLRDARFPRSFSSGKVSVLIPALENRAVLLDQRSLPSVEAQTFRDFEVIVVTELYSPEIASAVRKRGDAFQYFWGTKKTRALRRAGPVAMWCSGAAPNLNLALRKARGEFFARMDDDDEWLPNHLENAVNTLRESGAHFVSSNAFSSSGSLLPVAELDDSSFGSEYRWRRIRGSVGTTITWVYRRHLRGYRFNPHSWKKKYNRPVDYDFMLRVGAGGAKMVFSAEATARECLRPGANGLTGHRAYQFETEKERGAD